MAAEDAMQLSIGIHLAHVCCIASPILLFVIICSK
jgi:hypothetical protein